MATNQEYWKKRSLQRLTISEQIAEEAIKRTLALYEEALRIINQEILSIYNNYSRKGILDKTELRKALTPKGRREFLKKVQESAEALGIDMAEVMDARYLSRLTRAEALKVQIDLQIASIAPKEIQITTDAYRDILNKSYKGSQRDLALQGLSPAFSTLDKPVADLILKSQWVGRNYSKSVWGNNRKRLAKELPQILGGAFSTGQSYQKTIKQIRERFDVAQYRAATLVRTEGNYFHNQAELQSYVDDGIDSYMFDAFIDGRTSNICRELDGKIFKTENAVAGENYPPMHGNCRSTTQVVIPDEIDDVSPEDRTARLEIGQSNEAVAKTYIDRLVRTLK